jgi:hypothetical protein
MKRSSQNKIPFSFVRVPAILSLLIVLLLDTGCKKYLTIPLPVDNIAGSDAYSTDEIAAGVLNFVYISLEGASIAGSQGVPYYSGLYTDELQPTNTANATLKGLYSNSVNSGMVGGFWFLWYPKIYTANTTIEAMKSSSLSMKNQWYGESLFIRALAYFYLTNLYGDVALALTSDYKVNNDLGRASKSDVTKQIIADLVQARSLLSADYIDYKGNVVTDRARPNKAAASALLARVYLYAGDWANAEALADSVIGNSAYALETLSNVFLAASKENIWGVLPPQGSAYVTPDPAAYRITAGSSPTASGVAVTLSPQLLNSFEANDARYTNWVGVSTVTAGNPATSTNYYFANKYKVKNTSGNPPVETLVVLRLAEQYLIRAEARARQNNLSGAISDINVIRTRAGLPPTSATTQPDILAAIQQERRVEFFTEGGHRFFDLKRTGNIDAVMGIVSPQKGSAWSSFMQYWPIPVSETQANPNLTQTSGYSQ